MHSIDDFPEGLFDIPLRDQHPRRTREGLPRLTQETLDAFNLDMTNGESPVFKLNEWVKEIESENPVLLSRMQEIANYLVAKYYPDRPCEYIEGNVFSSLMIVYQLLKTQAINDNLSQFKKIVEYFGKAEK